ncbi:MAG: acyl-CoA dehydrogenase family protein [Deltaproteobacteria bacterium]|nr:acyl-CoA dehydrogenase family protein [Deltaproteobacteria bacterium]
MSPVKFDLFNPTDEHRQLRETMRRFVKDELEPQAAAHDEREEFNLKLFKRLGSEMGLFGLTVPGEEGGGGLDPVASVIVIEEMSRADPGFALSYLAHEVLFVHNFYHSGSAEQRRRYLGNVLSGEWIAGMAMTEPEVGTDVLGMRTVAERRGDRFVLNGTKQFITNGPYGQLFLVYAKTDPKKRDISAFLVESKFKGFSVGKKESKLGMRSSPTSCLVFEDLEVPAENLIGDEGRATVHMMRNLEIERITLSAQSLGISQRCVEEMSRYAVALRKSFGRPLIEHGQMQRLVAESYAETEAARAFVYHVAHQIDPKERRSLGAASAKLFAPTVGEKVSRNAIQVLGGYGYCREYPVERMLRDAILLSIGGGTNEAMQKNIARDLQREYG